MILTLAIFQSNRKQAREQIQIADFNAVKTDVNGLKISVAEINVKLGVFWKDVSFDAAKILHQPHPDAAEMDSLIDKYLAEQLRGVDLKRLIELLEATRDDSALLEGRRLAASQMLRAITQRYELMNVHTAIRQQQESP
jgi:hypothetical protein